MNPKPLLIAICCVVLSACGGDTPDPSSADVEADREGVEAVGDVYSGAIGFWAPNEEALIKLMINQSNEPLQRGEVSEDELTEMARQMAKGQVLEFREDLTTMMYGEYSSESGTVKILTTRPERGEIDADLEAEDGELEKATIVLDGDHLTVKHREGDGSPDKTPTIVFDRLTQEEGKRRIAAIKEAEGN